MAWNSVDCDDDLKQLNDLVCWEDANLVEVYARGGHEPFFPSDVCRSGYAALNFFLLYLAQFRNVEYVEFALIHCEWVTYPFLNGPFFRGKIDALKRVEVWNREESLQLRCARLIYRLHADKTIRLPYFCQAEMLPAGSSNGPNSKSGLS